MAARQKEAGGGEQRFRPVENIGVRDAEGKRGKNGDIGTPISGFPAGKMVPDPGCQSLADFLLQRLLPRP